MKPMTLLLIAGGFLAGLAAGMSGPLGEARTGLWQMTSEAAPITAKMFRVTASVDARRDGFQLTDFRWNMRTTPAGSGLCEPKDELGHAALPDIQHL